MYKFRFVAIRTAMNPLFCCLALAGVIMTGRAADQSDAAKIQGNWTPVKAELGGQPMPDVVLKTISLSLDKGKYEVFVGGNPDRGTYTIDSSTKPKSMSIIGTEGPNNGKTFPAIYELNGETLRICYDLSGKQLPAEFKSLPGTRLYLVTYNRKKG